MSNYNDSGAEFPSHFLICAVSRNWITQLGGELNVKGVKRETRLKSDPPFRFGIAACGDSGGTRARVGL